MFNKLINFLNFNDINTIIISMDRLYNHNKSKTHNRISNFQIGGNDLEILIELYQSSFIEVSRAIEGGSRFSSVLQLEVCQ